MHLVLVLPDGLVYDVLVAPLESEVLALELLLDELLESAGGDGIGNDKLTGRVFQHDSCCKSDQTVTVYLFALRVNSAAAVNVRVKNNAEVGTESLYSLTY